MAQWPRSRAIALTRAATEFDIPERLPIYPLVTTVVFPSGVAALQIADEKNLQLVDSLNEEDDVVGLFCLLAGDGGRSGPKSLQSVGVAARVVQKLKLGSSRQQLLCHGLARVRLEELESTEPFLTGKVELVESGDGGSEVAANALMAKALTAYETLAQADTRYSQETVEVLRMNAEAGASFFSDLMASFLNVPMDEKRKLISMTDPLDRLRFLLDLTDAELAKASVGRDIQRKVREQIEEKRREHYLREQLKIIQDSLGESTGPKREAAEYRALIEGLPLDDDSKRVLERECDRLAMMSEQSAEYPVQSNYLDTIFGLPWWESTDDRLELREVERHLSRHHYGVDEIKERLLDYLSVVKLKGHIHGPVLCLSGPPGTGKTSLGRSIAGALGRKFVRISLGGVSDESEIRGHRKTYVGAMPGKLIAAYDKAGSRNPVILLDEIDKMSNSLRGDPAAALLEVLDPEQNHAFLDRYLGVPFDLSETLFIATANLLDGIPGPLRDRMEVLTIAGYTEEEKVQIGRRFLLPRLLEEHGLEPKSIQLTRPAVLQLVRGYTSEAGLRGLERRLATICRKVARRRASGRKKSAPAKVRIGADKISVYLGPVLFSQEFAGRQPEVGLATGLAWTGAGGSILFVEASRMEGEGRVEVTGQLGEVMKESVQTAHSYVRSHARGLEIPGEILRGSDIHIHFPAGAIPKDGPSAGVAAATCLASLLSGRPVRHDVAMTGEITLRGKILSVGGIKEKVLAAHRAQIKKVLLPLGNKKDLDKVPDEVREQIEIVFVNRVEEAWKEALVPLLMANSEDLERIRPGA